MSTQADARFARVCCPCESDGQLVHFYTNVFSFIFTSCEYPITQDTTVMADLVSAMLPTVKSCIKAADSMTFLVKFCRLLYETGFYTRQVFLCMSTLKPGLCVI